MLPTPSEPLNLRPVPPTPEKKHPIPNPKHVKSVPTASGNSNGGSGAFSGLHFEYVKSKDGFEGNLLVMLHGMGDTEQPFLQLAKQINLPGTCILSLRGFFQVPLMDTPSFSYLPLSPLHFLIPPTSSSPTSEQLRALQMQTLPMLNNLLTYLVKECSWDLEGIHLFGWGEGGSVALECGRLVGKEGIEVEVENGKKESRKRLGSIISICGPLLSTPSVGSPPLSLPTPILYFHRPRPTKTQSPTNPIPTALSKTFSNPQALTGVYEKERANEFGEDGGMVRGEGEFRGLMKFWSEVLRRKGVGMGGEVYEVVR